ncbi:ATP-binding protein [Floridanema evergladense]|uniref:histidine kinase n=1 Tax=Floridaenema evergladense BLCC-F167 TaxID=3153639 RepID=A0ABV4WEI7_9CYAN
MNKIWLSCIPPITHTLMRKSLPILLGVVASIAVLFLWYQLSVQEQLNIAALTRSEATTIEINLSHELTNRIRALQRMAKRWENSNGTPRELWEKDADTYINDFYGYRAIEYIDPSYHVSWIVPLAGNEAAQNLDLSQEPRRQITLKIAQELRQPIVTGTISLVQGGKGFLVSVPLFVGDRFDGFILGVFQFPVLFEGILPISKGYKIQIYDRNQLIYSQGSSSLSNLKQTSVFQAYGVNWQIEVYPNLALLAETKSLLPNVVLVAGLISAWLLAIVVYLVQLSYHRIRKFKQTNRQLKWEINQRKEIETALAISQSRFAGILDIASDAIISIDENYIITLFNQGAERIFGYKSQEILGKPLSLLLPERFAKSHENYVQNYSRTSGETRQMAERGEIFGRRKDGTEFPAEASISKLNINGEMIFTTFLRDITDRKRSEIELRQAKEEAEAANLAKSIFLANMSHELRTPLNIILGFTQVMERDRLLTPNQREDLETIRRSGDHLLSLINDILDLSKIETGHYTLEETAFDLIALLHSLKSMLSERASSKKLQLIFDISPKVPQFIITDAQKLRQILLNLLSNAIKFTNQGSVILQVTETTTIIPSSSTRLQFQVKDTGVGIATEELETIFDAFVQAQAGKESVNGTGLGLTISRKLLELIGGEISVRSTLGQGSTFTFTLPVTITNAINIEPEQNDRPIIGIVSDRPQPRILVVDDRKENRLLLVKLLLRSGFVVREAGNGQEAIQLWQEWQPDLIFMDIRMPILDGCEATRQIRAMETEPTTIIIALSAQASEGDRLLALNAGCNYYISKPFQEKTLFITMKEYLGVEYIYAEPKLTVKQQPDSSVSLVNQFTEYDPKLLYLLKKEWFTEMENSAVCGDDVAIRKLIDQIPPDLSKLAIYLTKLVDNYQFEQIIESLSTLSASN